MGTVNPSLESSTLQPGNTNQPYAMSAIRRIIHTNLAPAAIGPSSQAVLVERHCLSRDSWVWMLKQAAWLKEVLRLKQRKHWTTWVTSWKPGASFKNVVKTTVLLADMNDFGKVNEVYKKYFTENYPARMAYQVAALPRGGMVEIDATAVLDTVVETPSQL